jgi:hypothetical protein
MQSAYNAIIKITVFTLYEYLRDKIKVPYDTTPQDAVLKLSLTFLFVVVYTYHMRQAEKVYLQYP